MWKSVLSDCSYIRRCTTLFVTIGTSKLVLFLFIQSQLTWKLDTCKISFSVFFKVNPICVCMCWYELTQYRGLDYFTYWIDVVNSHSRIYERNLIWPTFHEHAGLLCQLSNMNSSSKWLKGCFCHIEAICVSTVIDFVADADCGAAFIFREFEFSCMEDHTTCLVTICL